MNPTLNRPVHFFYRLGVLGQVEHLPPHQIPSRCKHSDILKNIMVNCSVLIFRHLFSHVKANQDDEFHLHELEWEPRLNCAIDDDVKNEVWKLDFND